MTPESIKASLLLKGVTAAEIARKHGVSNVAVHHVIHGKSKSWRLANEIAIILQKPVCKIWPELYKNTRKI